MSSMQIIERQKAARAAAKENQAARTTRFHEMLAARAASEKSEEIEVGDK